LLPEVLDEQGVLGKFKVHVAKLGSVRQFTLCPGHDEAEKWALLKQIELAAIREQVSKTARALKDKAAKGKSFKLQRVTHR